LPIAPQPFPTTDDVDARDVKDKVDEPRKIEPRSGIEEIPLVGTECENVVGGDEYKFPVVVAFVGQWMLV